MESNTVTLQRVVRAPAERIYKAFISPEAMVKWNPPHGFVARLNEHNPVVGGRYHMVFINLASGEEHSFGGTFREMVKDQKLVYDDQFDDPSLPGMMLTTVVLTPVLNGTELRITQQGIPETIPLEFCYAGWQESLQLLALLVEACIPVAEE